MCCLNPCHNPNGRSLKAKKTSFKEVRGCGLHDTGRNPQQGMQQEFLVLKVMTLPTNRFTSCTLASFVPWTRRSRITGCQERKNACCCSLCSCQRADSLPRFHPDICLCLWWRILVYDWDWKWCQLSFFLSEVCLPALDSSI